MSQQASAEDVLTISCAKKCFVAHRQMGGERLSWAKWVACRMTAFPSLLIATWCSKHLGSPIGDSGRARGHGVFHVGMGV